MRKNDQRYGENAKFQLEYTKGSQWWIKDLLKKEIPEDEEKKFEKEVQNTQITLK